VDPALPGRQRPRACDPAGRYRRVWRSRAGSIGELVIL